MILVPADPDTVTFAIYAFDVAIYRASFANKAKRCTSIRGAVMTRHVQSARSPNKIIQNVERRLFRFPV